MLIMNFLFISRHRPTLDQINLADEQGIILITVDDLDAFSDNLYTDLASLVEKHKAHGVVAMHPLIALAAVEQGLCFGSFRNANRAPVGEKPQFYTDLFAVRYCPRRPM